MLNQILTNKEAARQGCISMAGCYEQVCRTLYRTVRNVA